MNLYELLNESSGIDEGLKSFAAKAALAAGLAAPMMAKGPVHKKPVQKTTIKKKTNIQNTAPKVANPAAAETALVKEARAKGITGTELAAFLAQCAHETNNFTRLKELGGSLDFKKYDPKYAPAKAKLLGNSKPGDGVKYAGRGFIQLTGRYNYRTAGMALGLPLEKYPELLEKDMSVAAKVAVWFWQHRVQPKIDNFNNTRDVTHAINSGLHGLERRAELFKDYKQKITKSDNQGPGKGGKIARSKASLK